MPWPNSELDTVADQSFFLEHGDTAYWYQAQICPCGSDPSAPSDMSQANTTCNVCGGLGRFYPNPPQLIRGIVSNIDPNRDILPEGFELDASDVIWSSDPWSHETLSSFDAIVLANDLQAWPYEMQVVVRGFESTDTLWYSASELSDIYTVDPYSGSVNSYTGVTVNGKTIDWSNAPSAPSQGTFYSVRYRAQYEWYVYMPPMVRFERSQSLGQKVLLRKRHIVWQSNLPTLQQP